MQVVMVSISISMQLTFEMSNTSKITKNH